MNKIALLCLFVSILAVSQGCRSIPYSYGYISENISGFDGSIELNMQPNFVHTSHGISGADMRMGLYWHSTMANDNLILILIPEKGKGTPISSGSPLHFNINGKMKTLLPTKIQDIENHKPSPGETTYFHPNLIKQNGVQYYVVKKQFIEEITSAKDVWIRVDLQDTYIEGVFSADSDAGIQTDFLLFLNRLNKSL